MTLQILIPRYNESDYVISLLLETIAMQQNISFDDIGVIICDDGSDSYLADYFLDSYPFKIEYLFNKHNGVSAARQSCLDHATADYVMFCDADDYFCSLLGIYQILLEISRGEFDVLISCFIQETKDEDGNSVFVNMNCDTTFVHGKVYRREYLLENDIKWDSELKCHEDSYFNALAIQLLPDKDRGKYCKQSFYCWKWRDDSTCRRDSLYIQKTFNDMLKSNAALVRQFLKRDKPDLAQYYAVNMVYETYYQMNMKSWRDINNQKYRDDVEAQFREYYAEFGELFETMDDKKKNELSNNIRSRLIKEGMEMESITLRDWLDKVKK